jgi:prepilin-type N-terminal cleavage/methylation domain-containing protein
MHSIISGQRERGSDRQGRRAAQLQPVIRPQTGFTVIEVLVAVVVFSVGLVAVSGMQTRSIEQSTLSDQMTVRVNTVTHWAETLTRLPVRDETVSIDGATSFDVAINDLFKEGTACQYGETCEWSYIEYDDRQTQRIRQRITRDYPLRNLVMVELEALPRGVAPETAQLRAVRTAFVRSTRWN